MAQAWRSTGSGAARDIADFCARIFLLTGLPVLILLCIAIPPFQGSDEQAHFLRTLSVASGQIVPQVMAHDPTQYGGPSAGGAVDTGAAELTLGFRPKPGHHYEPADVVPMAERSASGRATYAHHSNTAIYAPVTYLPGSVAVLVARALAAPILYWLYAARLAGALTAAAILYWAIRRGGDAAPALLVAATLPVTLFQGAVLTTDTMLLPALLLLAAMLRRIASRTPMTAFEHGATAATLMIIALAKVAYVPIVLLPAIAAWLADRRLSARVQFYGLMAGVALLLWLGWAWIVHDKIFPMYAGVRVDTPAQIKLLLHEPGQVAMAIARTMMRDLPSMSLGLTGSRLGLNDFMLPKPFIVFAMLLLIGSMIPATAPARTDPVLIAATLGIVIACYIAIYLLLYLQFNAVGARTVEGVQARYLTPLAFVLLTVFPKLLVSQCTMDRAIRIIAVCAGADALVTLVGATMNYWKL